MTPPVRRRVTGRAVVPLTDEQRALAADPAHVRLALAHARRVCRFPARDLDEYEADALQGLVNAARSFDPARGVSFGAYLRTCVSGAISDGRRRLMPKGFRRHDSPPAPRVASLSERPIGRPVVLADTVADRGPPAGRESDAADAFEALLLLLTEPGARRAVRLYFGAGLHQGEIAAALGVSRARVHQIIRAALRQLRRSLGGAPS